LPCPELPALISIVGKITHNPAKVAEGEAKKSSQHEPNTTATLHPEHNDRLRNDKDAPPSHPTSEVKPEARTDLGKAEDSQPGTSHPRQTSHAPARDSEEKGGDECGRLNAVRTYVGGIQRLGGTREEGAERPEDFGEIAQGDAGPGGNLDDRHDHGEGREEERKLEEGVGRLGLHDKPLGEHGYGTEHEHEYNQDQGHGREYGTGATGERGIIGVGGSSGKSKPKLAAELVEHQHEHQRERERENEPHVDFGKGTTAQGYGGSTLGGTETPPVEGDGGLPTGAGYAGRVGEGVRY
jgi:hypothetical protein